MQRKDYYEIYPSEVAARKISKHLDNLIEDKPRVYRKTLLRYKKLAYLLLECVTKIVRMLQSELLLSSSDSEFQELSTDFDLEQFDELRESVDNLGNLMDRTDSADARRLAADTLKTYKAVFNRATTIDFGYIEANECAGLLDYWMTRRFSGTNTNFKFQIKQLPIWATFIIIAYGKYRSIGHKVKFMTEFKTWCDSLEGDDTNCWALPYTVFNMTKTIDPNNYTIDAMVIYDILINGCLYQLMDIKIPMDSAYIANRIRDYYPEYTMEVRTRFNHQQKLIDQLHLCPSCDVEEEQ